MRTCLGVGKGVMMMRKVEPAGGRYRLQLMVREGVPEMPSGCPQGVMEDIIGIIHAVYSEGSLEAALIEACIVGDKRQAFYLGSNLFPDKGEDGCVIGILGTQAVHLAAEPLVVLRFRMYEAVERIDDFSVAYDDDSYAADAAGLLVGRLEIYCGKVCHMLRELREAGARATKRPIRLTETAASRTSPS